MSRNPGGPRGPWDPEVLGVPGSRESQGSWRCRGPGTVSHFSAFNILHVVGLQGSK